MNPLELKYLKLKLSFILSSQGAQREWSAFGLHTYHPSIYLLTWKASFLLTVVGHAGKSSSPVLCLVIFSHHELVAVLLVTVIMEMLSSRSSESKKLENNAV